jgi:hypothetical protein
VRRGERSPFLPDSGGQLPRVGRKSPGETRRTSSGAGCNTPAPAARRKPSRWLEPRGRNARARVVPRSRGGKPLEWTRCRRTGGEALSERIARRGPVTRSALRQRWEDRPSERRTRSSSPRNARSGNRSHSPRQPGRSPRIGASAPMEPAVFGPSSGQPDSRLALRKRRGETICGRVTFRRGPRMKRCSHADDRRVPAGEAAGGRPPASEPCRDWIHPDGPENGCRTKFTRGSRALQLFQSRRPRDPTSGRPERQLETAEARRASSVTPTLRTARETEPPLAALPARILQVPCRTLRRTDARATGKPIAGHPTGCLPRSVVPTGFRIG